MTVGLIIRERLLYVEPLAYERYVGVDNALTFIVQSFGIGERKSGLFIYCQIKPGAERMTDANPCAREKTPYGDYEYEFERTLVDALTLFVSIAEQVYARIPERRI